MELYMQWNITLITDFTVTFVKSAVSNHLNTWNNIEEKHTGQIPEVNSISAFPKVHHLYNFKQGRAVYNDDHNY